MTHLLDFLKKENNTMIELKRESDPSIESLTKDIDYCKRAKDELCKSVSSLEHTISEIIYKISQFETKIEELEKKRIISDTEHNKDRELYTRAVDELKNQMSNLQISVTEKLLSQEKQFSEQTTTMITSHDMKTLKLFEKIEDRIEKNEEKTTTEFKKIHEKMDIIAKNQWKFMGGLGVLIFCITIFYPEWTSNKSYKENIVKEINNLKHKIESNKSN